MRTGGGLQTLDPVTDGLSLSNNEFSRVEWIGAIADLSTALKFSGNIEGGGRVVFDVPENQLGQAIGLLALRGVTLRITVEALR